MNQHTDVNDQQDGKKVENEMRQHSFFMAAALNKERLYLIYLLKVVSSDIPISLSLKLSAGFLLSTSLPTLACFTTFEAHTYMHTAVLI